MIRVADLLGSRRTPQFAVVVLISAGMAGCSADTSSRFAQDPFSSNPYSSRQDATGTVAPRYAQPQHSAPYGRVESQPLPQYNRPATTPPAYPQYSQPQLPQYNRPSTPQYSSAPLSPPAISKPQSYPSYSGGGTSGGGSGMASYTPPDSSRSAEPSRHAGHRAEQDAPRYAANTGTRADTTASTNGTTIIVGTGDTLDGIARRYNVSSASILAANGYRGPRALQPGQQLIIPRQAASRQQPASQTPAPKVANSSTYHVNHGDTLYNISRRHQVSVSQLAAANGLSTDARLRVGSRITIPSGGAQVAAVQTPVMQQPKPAERAEKPMVVAQAPVARPAVAAPAAMPVQKANLASATTTPVEAETPSSVKSAEATGALPTFRWPVRGRVIAGYGAKTNGKQNDGINVAVPEGTPVKAAEDGVVAYAGSELKGYGNLVLIRHSNGYVTAYAHASEIKVKRGDKISRGQVIGKAGQSGDVNSPQLHFEIRKGSSPVDPLQFLSGA